MKLKVKIYANYVYAVTITNAACFDLTVVYDYHLIPTEFNQYIVYY